MSLWLFVNLLLWCCYMKNMSSLYIICLVLGRNTYFLVVQLNLQFHLIIGFLNKVQWISKKLQHFLSHLRYEIKQQSFLYLLYWLLPLVYCMTQLQSMISTLYSYLEVFRLLISRLHKIFQFKHNRHACVPGVHIARRYGLGSSGSRLSSC